MKTILRGSLERMNKESVASRLLRSRLTSLNECSTTVERIDDPEINLMYTHLHPFWSAHQKNRKAYFQNNIIDCYCFKNFKTMEDYFGNGKKFFNRLFHFIWLYCTTDQCFRKKLFHHYFCSRRSVQKTFLANRGSTGTFPLWFFVKISKNTISMISQHFSRYMIC